MVDYSDRNGVSQKRSFKTFVQNRVVETRRLASLVLWRHVPSENYPADVVFRVCNASRLKDETQRWEVPNFLKSPKEHWPAQK